MRDPRLPDGWWIVPGVIFGVTVILLILKEITQ